MSPPAILKDQQFYELARVLKLPSSAVIPSDPDKKQIEKAFRRMALKTHPDKGGDPVEFRRANEAYSRLMAHASKLAAMEAEAELAQTSVIIEISKQAAPAWAERLKTAYGVAKTANVSNTIFEGPYKQFKGRSLRTGPLTIVLYEDPEDKVPKLHVRCENYMAWIQEQSLPLHLHVQKNKKIMFDQWRIMSMAEFGFCKVEHGSSARHDWKDNSHKKAKEEEEALRREKEEEELRRRAREAEIAAAKAEEERKRREEEEEEMERKRKKEAEERHKPWWSKYSDRYGTFHMSETTPPPEDDGVFPKVFNMAASGYTTRGIYQTNQDIEEDKDPASNPENQEQAVKPDKQTEDAQIKAVNDDSNFANTGDRQQQQQHPEAATTAPSEGNCNNNSNNSSKGTANNNKKARLPKLSKKAGVRKADKEGILAAAAAIAGGRRKSSIHKAKTTTPTSQDGGSNNSSSNHNANDDISDPSKATSTRKRPFDEDQKKAAAVDGVVHQSDISTANKGLNDDGDDGDSVNNGGLGRDRKRILTTAATTSTTTDAVTAASTAKSSEATSTDDGHLASAVAAVETIATNEVQVPAPANPGSTTSAVTNQVGAQTHETTTTSGDPSLEAKKTTASDTGNVGTEAGATATTLPATNTVTVTTETAEVTTTTTTTIATAITGCNSVTTESTAAATASAAPTTETTTTPSAVSPEVRIDVIGKDDSSSSPADVNEVQRVAQPEPPSPSPPEDLIDRNLQRQAKNAKTTTEQNSEEEETARDVAEAGAAATTATTATDTSTFTTTATVAADELCLAADIAKKTDQGIVEEEVTAASGETDDETTTAAAVTIAAATPFGVHNEADKTDADGDNAGEAGGEGHESHVAEETNCSKAGKVGAKIKEEEEENEEEREAKMTPVDGEKVHSPKMTRSRRTMKKVKKQVTLKVMDSLESVQKAIKDTFTSSNRAHPPPLPGATTPNEDLLSCKQQACCVVEEEEEVGGGLGLGGGQKQQQHSVHAVRSSEETPSSSAEAKKTSKKKKKKNSDNFDAGSGKRFAGKKDKAKAGLARSKSVQDISLLPLSPVASRRELFEQQSRASSNKSHPPPPTTPQPIGRSLATGLNEVGTEYLGLRNLDQTYGKDNGFRRGFVRKSTALGTSTGFHGLSRSNTTANCVGGAAAKPGQQEDYRHLIRPGMSPSMIRAKSQVWGKEGIGNTKE